MINARVKKDTFIYCSPDTDEGRIVYELWLDDSVVVQSKEDKWSCIMWKFNELRPALIGWVETENLKFS